MSPLARGKMPAGEPASISIDARPGPATADGVRATYGERGAVTLPPPGPAWFGAVMGTGILSTLLRAHQADLPGALATVAGALATILFVVDWLLLVGLTAGFGRRAVRDRRVLADSIRDAAQAPMWGMVAMGVLSAGTAASANVPVLVPRWTSAAWAVDAVCWAVGTLLGVITALGFGARIVGREVGDPTPVWGLPLVPPMVSATAGAALVPHIGSAPGRVWMLVALIGCFFLALFLGLVVFAVAYHHAWRRAPLPLTATTAAWIPLGIVGQSTAAGQSIAGQARPQLIGEAGGAVVTMAHLYGYVVLAVGVPLFAWAAVTTVRGFRLRMPFVPGWWSLTFPIGTLSLGSHLLGESAGSVFFGVLGLTLCGLLLCTWTLCAGASLRAVVRRAGSRG